MNIRNKRLLVASCLLTSLMSAGFVVVAKDKDHDKPARSGMPAAAGHTESSANRVSRPAAKETPRQHVETAPRVERRNDNNPPVSNRPLPQANHGNGSAKRDDAPRDNRANNDRGPAKPIGAGPIIDPRSSVNLRPDRSKVDSTFGGQPEMRVDRRDRTPPGQGIPQSGGIQSGNPSLGSLNQRGNDTNKTDRRVERSDRRDDSIPKQDLGRLGGNQAPRVSAVGNHGDALPSGPSLVGTVRDDRQKNGLPKSDIPRHDPGRPNLKSGNDAKTGVVRGNVNLPGSGNATIAGRNEIRHQTTPVRIEKNGHVLARDAKPEITNLQPDVSDRIAKLHQVRDHKEFERQLNELKALPDARSHSHLAGLKLDRVSGVYQQRVEQHDFRHLHESDIGRRLNLDRQFQLHRHGDLSRQMNLGPALIQAGGWQHRHHGTVIPTFTRSSFSVWYAGGGYYPRYCWTPRWTPWVDWCWWDTCLPIYDPRPVYCRPIVYTPCPTWVVYEYPVWQPLPVATCGTWVDVPPVVVDSGTDLQLLATRFVDNGHPDQNLGPRYRVWLRNNGPLSTTIPFNVVLIAANSPVPTPDLPQAGAVVNGIAAGEIQTVDIRLPLDANRLAVTPEGQRVPFGYLHILVDSHRDLVESNESNNGSVVARNDILPVDPAAFSSDVSAGAPGTLINVAGEGLGPEPGQVIVSINGLQLQAEIHGWYDLGVRFALPNLALAGPTDADILIVRGDGAAANPLDFDLVPLTLLGESLLPPLPSP